MPDLLQKYDEIIEDILMRVGVPSRFMNATKFDFRPSVWSAVESFFAGDSFFISGGIGLGKTHLICALIHEAIYRYVSKEVKSLLDLKIVSVPRLLIGFKAAFKRAGISEEEILSDYLDVGTLILDDLGAEKSSDWSIEILYILIDTRYTEESQTIITSNLSLDGIAESLGDRIASRISEMCTIVELKGNDKRLQKSKKSNVVIDVTN